MACENGECVVYEERDKTKYIEVTPSTLENFLTTNWRPMPSKAEDEFEKGTGEKVLSH